jgi:hypothetical protein
VAQAAGLVLFLVTVVLNLLLVLLEASRIP